jgi:hypothetical protein
MGPWRVRGDGIYLTSRRRCSGGNMILFDSTPSSPGVLPDGAIHYAGRFMLTHLQMPRGRRTWLMYTAKGDFTAKRWQKRECMRPETSRH